VGGCLPLHDNRKPAPDEEYRAFVTSRAAALHRTAYLLCGDWHLANDLVQEALAKAFRHWRRVRRADSPDAYVRRILINEANRHWRRHRGRPATVDQVAVAPSKSTSVGPLVRLADYLQANIPQPAGDATLVLRTTTYPGSAPITVADLYGDNGKYFFAHTRSGLPAQVAADHDQGNGIAARELAAARYATHGDLAVARQRMADARTRRPARSHRLRARNRHR
jgi:Sigma-70 region 2